GALERVAAAAWPEVAHEDKGRTMLDGGVLLSLPEEIGLRILVRAVGGHADQRPDRLAKNETLFEAVREALRHGQDIARTLAGARIGVRKGTVTVTTAPPRRTKPS